MKKDSAFVKLNESPEKSHQITFFWNDQPVTAQTGDTIAAALLAAGIIHTRETLVSASPRSPFCMMGTCFECRVEVDGESNVQGCMRLIEDGMKVRSQRN